MRTTTKIISNPVGGSPGSIGGSRVTLIQDDAIGAPNKTQVEIIGGELQAVAAHPGGRDPLKTRVQITGGLPGGKAPATARVKLVAPGAAAAELAPLPTGATPREQLAHAIEAQRANLEALEREGRAGMDRLEELEMALHDLDEREHQAAEEAAELAASNASNASGDGQEEATERPETTIIEATAEIAGEGGSGQG